jgi:hypothetical protein
MKARICSPPSISAFSNSSGPSGGESLLETLEGSLEFEGLCDTITPLKRRVDSTSFVSANQNAKTFKKSATCKSQRSWETQTTALFVIWEIFRSIGGGNRFTARRLKNRKPIVERSKPGGGFALLPILKRLVARRIPNALSQYEMDRLKTERKFVALDKKIPHVWRQRFCFASWSAHKIIVAKALFTVSKNVSKSMVKDSEIVVKGFA